jgi:hypothetical protein
MQLLYWNIRTSKHTSSLPSFKTRTTKRFLHLNYDVSYVFFLFDSLSHLAYRELVSLQVNRKQLQANFRVDLSFSHLLVDRTYHVYPRCLQSYDLIVFQISNLPSLISDNIIFQNLITLKLKGLVHKPPGFFPPLRISLLQTLINSQAQMFSKITAIIIEARTPNRPVPL